MTRIKRLKNGDLAEETIQKVVMEWVNINPVTKKYAGCFIHCPNEGKRTPWNGKLMKDMGMRKGVVDLFIAVPRHGHGGAWIELKSACGFLKPEQKQFLKDMSEQNFYTAVCWSIEEAISVISWWFGIKAK